jgi:hypothetical protein
MTAIFSVNYFSPLFIMSSAILLTSKHIYPIASNGMKSSDKRIDEGMMELAWLLAVVSPGDPRRVRLNAALFVPL